MIMHVCECFLLLALPLWLVLTVLYNCDVLFVRAFKKYDPFNLIPGWRFFAPSPLRVDFDIFFRDKVDQNVGPFQSALYPSAHPLLRPIFNPQGRIRKSVYRIAGNLAKQANSGKSTEELMVSLEYLALLSLVANIPAAVGARRQIVIVASAASDPESLPYLFFSSQFHNVHSV